MKPFAVIAALLFTLVAGCETASRSLDPASVQSIRPGVTTRAEVIRQFGPPTETVSEQGRTLLFYKRVYWGTRPGVAGASAFAPTEDSYARGLSVLLDDQDRVIRSHYSRHAIRMAYGAGAAAAGNRLADDVAAGLKVNQTTRAEVLKLLGEPMMESLNTAGQLVLDWAHVETSVLGHQPQVRFLRVIFNERDVVVVVKDINDQ